MNTDVITVDPDVQFGTPVFTGTRVPVESLFGHLEQGITIDEFLDDFPSVTKEQAVAVLELASKVLSSESLLNAIHETAA